MVPDELRNDIWQGLLDSARSTLYYTTLAERYRRRDRSIKYLTLISATGSFSAWLNIMPSSWQSPVQLIASGGVALFVLWGLMAEYARKEALSYTVAAQCKKIEDKWCALWVDVKRGVFSRDNDIVSHRDKLKQAEREWTQLTGYVGISGNSYLHEECAAKASRVMKKRYDT